MRKISFIAYSIGGLVARYAIGRLYNAPENEADGVGTICGLMALNFITLASPHLGSIGHKQVSTFHLKFTLCFLNLVIGIEVAMYD
jgi:triacylglycerol esterase/lipase EstA (alpha/beta hydrolase family)